MKSLLVSFFLGAFLFTGCGGDTQEGPPPAANNNTAEQPANANPVPPPPAEATKADEDCPAAVDAYAKFVDKYVDYIKKAADGDMSALTDVASLMEQANKAGKELASAQTDLTAGCLKKYTAINKKMTDAAMEMSKALPNQTVSIDAAQKAAEKSMDAAQKAAEKSMDVAQQAAEKALEAAGCMEKCQGMTDPMKAATCMQGCM